MFRCWWMGWGFIRSKPLDGFTLANVSGTCAKGISLANIREGGGAEHQGDGIFRAAAEHQQCDGKGAGGGGKD